MDEATESASPPPPPLPSPDPRQTPVSPFRVLGILFIGALVGTLAGGMAVYLMPKIYLSRARVEGMEHSGHAREITRLRAEMVVRNQDFDHMYREPFEKMAEKVRKAVRLKPDASGVTIEARDMDPRECQLIVNELALSLDTPAVEQEMAAKNIRIASKQEGHWSKELDIENLRELLEEQAREAGFTGGWGKLLLGPEEDPVLTGLAKNEDFARRLATIKQLIVEQGYYGPPGEPIHPPNERITLGKLPQVPDSPDVERLMNSARLVGTLLAGLYILALLRWKPATLRPEPRPPLPKRERQSPVENDDPW